MNAAQKYRYEFVDYDAFMPEFKVHSKALFSEGNRVELDLLHNAEENETRHALAKQQITGLKLCVLAYDGDRVIGWSFGEQEFGDRFYMRSSAVYPEYRRQGVYRTLMRMMIERVTETGFQHIYSRHIASNNAVIIAKLQFGFMLDGMEIAERYGTLLHLAYFPNKNRGDLFRYRTGEHAAMPEIVQEKR